MRLLISYIKEKLLLVGMYGMILVIFCMLFWLKGIPLDVILYGAELSTAWLLFFGILDFYFYWKRYQKLLDLAAALPYELKEFPEAKDRIEAEYQEITETIFAWREMLENEVLLSRKDTSDYYSLWVHQIKTPISAMHFLMQSFEEKVLEFEDNGEETLEFLNEMKMEDLSNGRICWNGAFLSSDGRHGDRSEISMVSDRRYSAEGDSQIFSDFYFEKNSSGLSGQQTNGVD